MLRKWDQNRKNKNLIKAVCKRDEQTVNKLLDAKADVHYQDGYGCSALHYALRRQLEPETIVKMVNKGFDLMLKNIYGTTP